MNKTDFSIFKSQPDLIYLDGAASAQKPDIVLSAMQDFYMTTYANVHRGAYELSERATLLYEEARQTVADFIHARPNDIIFVRGATEGINLIAQTYGQTLKSGDEIILSEAEHHSNLVPWQMLAAKNGVKILFARVDESGLLDIEHFESLLSNKTKLVAMTQMSNVLGTVFPVKDVVKKAHAVGAKVLIDGCQAIVHMEVDVADLDCDFYAFSGHKIYGPTGIGVLYARQELMNELYPWQGGGDMVKTVSYDDVIFAQTPARFEAGTPAFTEAIGLMSALKYLSSIGRDRICQHEKELSDYLMKRLSEFDWIVPLGDVSKKNGLVCFNIKGCHPQDVAMVLDRLHIAVRVGHHCAEPITKKYGVSSSIRASIGLYNEQKDIDAFIDGLVKAYNMLGM